MLKHSKILRISSLVNFIYLRTNKMSNQRTIRNSKAPNGVSGI